VALIRHPINRLSEKVTGAAIVDILVEDSLIVELEAVDKLMPIHRIQQSPHPP
jgi:hypothetical protein